MFSNDTSFYRNSECNQLISLDGNWQYITVKDYSTINFIGNNLYNELVSVPTAHNHPFRYCIFQFISDAQDHFYSFDISFSKNIERG